MVTRQDVSGLYSLFTFTLLCFLPLNPMPLSGGYFCCCGLSCICKDIWQWTVDSLQAR